MCAGKTAKRNSIIKNPQPQLDITIPPTVERVQWLVSSFEKRVASLMNTATAFRINVMKS